MIYISFKSAEPIYMCTNVFQESLTSTWLQLYDLLSSNFEDEIKILVIQQAEAYST